VAVSTKNVVAVGTIPKMLAVIQITRNYVVAALATSLVTAITVSLRNHPYMMKSLSLLRYFAIAIIVLLLDQLSKWSALSNLQMGIPEPVLPFMNWLLLFNPGAAFSFLAQGSGWQRWFFTIIGLAASAYIIWLLYKSQSEKLLCIALSLILGGALGNVLDRVMYGAVVDFIDLYYGNWHWPAFNIADSAICVGAALIIWGELRKSFGKSAQHH
jgi:signal peptidase II